MSDGVKITLGARQYEVVAQPIGRIRRKLVRIIGLAEGVVGIDGEIDSDLYSVVKTFIPDLAPLYELMGYASQDDYDAGREPEDDAYDAKSPTLPQIIEAVEAIYRVNGADRLVKLGKDLVGADVIRHRLRKAVMSWEPSASLPAPSGESGSESSTPTPPTSPEMSEAPSPSPDSSISSSPRRRLSELHFEALALATAVNAPKELKRLFSQASLDGGGTAGAGEVPGKWWTPKRGQRSGEAASE